MLDFNIAGNNWCFYIKSFRNSAPTLCCGYNVLFGGQIINSQHRIISFSF